MCVLSTSIVEMCPLVALTVATCCREILVECICMVHTGSSFPCFSASLCPILFMSSSIGITCSGGSELTYAHVLLFLCVLGRECFGTNSRQRINPSWLGGSDVCAKASEQSEVMGGWVLW